jgi:hypothetical protein
VPKPNPTYDPKHWLDRAAEMRALSEAMAMLRLADDYDKLADRAAARADGKRPKQPKER